MNPTAARTISPVPGSSDLPDLAQLGGQQHRKGRLIQLHADPEGFAARKVVLRPVAIATLGRDQVRQDMSRTRCIW